MKNASILFIFYSLVSLSTNCFSQETFKSNRLYFSALDPAIGLEKSISIKNEQFEFYFFLAMGNRLNSTRHDGFVRWVSSYNPKRDIYPYYMFGLRYYFEKNESIKNLKPFISLSEDPIGVGAVFRNDARFFCGIGGIYTINNRLNLLIAHNIGFNKRYRDYVVNANKPYYIYTINKTQLSLRYYINKKE
jgi:hypothetical protein